MNLLSDYRLIHKVHKKVTICMLFFIIISNPLSINAETHIAPIEIDLGNVIRYLCLKTGSMNYNSRLGISIIGWRRYISFEAFDPEYKISDFDAYLPLEIYYVLYLKTVKTREKQLANGKVIKINETNPLYISIEVDWLSRKYIDIGIEWYAHKYRETSFRLGYVYAEVPYLNESIGNYETVKAGKVYFTWNGKTSLLNQWNQEIK